MKHSVYVGAGGVGVCVCMLEYVSEHMGLCLSV